MIAAESRSWSHVASAIVIPVVISPLLAACERPVISATGAIVTGVDLVERGSMLIESAQPRPVSIEGAALTAAMPLMDRHRVSEVPPARHIDARSMPPVESAGDPVAGRCIGPSYDASLQGRFVDLTR